MQNKMQTNWTWEFFTPDELKCKCGKCHSTGWEMSSRFLSKATVARRVYSKPFIISSAYRCPQHNAAASKTGERGPHTTGRAMDILVSLDDAYDVVRILFNVGITRIGLKQSGDIKGRFIHFDDLNNDDGFPSPRIWTYP